MFVVTSPHVFQNYWEHSFKQTARQKQMLRGRFAIVDADGAPDVVDWRTEEHMESWQLRSGDLSWSPWKVLRVEKENERCVLWVRVHTPICYMIQLRYCCWCLYGGRGGGGLWTHKSCVLLIPESPFLTNERNKWEITDMLRLLTQILFKATSCTRESACMAGHVHSDPLLPEETLGQYGCI